MSSQGILQPWSTTLRWAIGVLVASACLWPSAARAQQRDRASASVLWDGRAALEGSPGDRIAIQETELSTAYPVLRRTNLTVLAGVRWTRYAFDVDAADFDDLTTHSVRLPLRLNYRGLPGWTLLASATPGLSTDFDGVNSDDLVMGALFLANRPLSPSLTLSAGAGYSQAFGTSRGFPALGATWQPREDFRVELIFPRPRVLYTAAPSLDLFAVFEPGGDQWNIRDQGRSRDLALEEYRAGVGFEWRRGSRLALVALAGAALERQLDLRDDGTRVFRRDIDDTWFLRAGLVFR